MNKLMTSQSTDRTLFVWLLLAGLLGTLVGVPFSIAVLDDPAAGGPVNPQRIWLGAVIEALFLLAPASAVGVWVGKKTGLGPRLLRELVSRAPGSLDRVRSILIPSIAISLAIAVPGLVGQSSLPEGALGPGLANPTSAEWFLRSLSAALTEEIAFRLGLMTLFVWVIHSVLRKPAFERPSLWAGNTLAALVFAGAHLPHVLSFGTPHWSVVILIVLFNSFGGVAMGWLYMRYGLISAILAHFVADVTAYVIPSTLAAVTGS
jgi:CAAX amino terminal protease family.